jgi:hypothetical protein
MKTLWRLSTTELATTRYDDILCFTWLVSPGDHTQ